MPDQIPVGSNYPDGRADCANMQTQVANAGVKLVRIGGGSSIDGYDYYGTDWNGTSASDNCYMAAIEAVGVNNADFLIQVPFSSGITPAQAATMVQRLATEYPGEVFYYAIGNEWDAYIKPGTSPARGYYASEIAALIKDYADDMKAIDATIKIVAPALTYYGAYDGNTPAAKIMPILLSGNNSASDITMVVPGQSYYYIDVVDFHTYAGGTDGDMTIASSTVYSTYRANSIAFPSGAFATTLSSSTNNLQNLLGTANSNHSRTGANALTYAVTEINIDWKNPASPIVAGNVTTNSVESLGARSFFAGQYLIDMFSEILENGTNTSNAKVAFVNPWSINESNGDGTDDDLSMTKGVMSSCSDPAPQPLSTYYHYQLMANNFSGTYFSNSATAQTNYKAFACSTATEIRVIIMNQNEQSSPRGTDNSTETFKINFLNGTTPSGATILFAFNMGNNSINGGGCSGGYFCCTIQKETTMLLTFDKSSGTLLKRREYSLQLYLGG